MSLSRFHRGAGCGAAVLLLLVACNGGHPVGQGRGPTDLLVTYGGQTSGLQMSECGTAQLTAVATFDNDGKTTRNDVTPRVHWTSSNPGAIDVSNGDIETAPGSGLVFPVGTVIARTTGIATIRGSYADALFSSVGVSAQAISSLRISPALTRLTPNSVATFALYGQPQNDQLEQNLSASTVWSLPSRPAAADLSGSTVIARSEPLDAPFQLEARLFTCNRKVTQTMSLGRVTGLQLSYEQPQDAPVPRVINDRLRVDAQFEDATAPPQNLSDEVEVKAADGYDPDIAGLSVVSSSAVVTTGTTAKLETNAYLLVAGLQEDKPVRLDVTFDRSGLNLTTQTREYQFSLADAGSLRIAPQTLDLNYPDLAKLSAYATFEDGIERPVTRFVAWSTEDADLLSVSASGIDGGLLVPQNVSGRARVFGQIITDTQGKIEDQATVNVHRQQ